MPLFFTIKTGNRTMKTHDSGKASNIVKQELEQNSANVAVKNLLALDNETNTLKLYIAATFFQRVVSRTPIDEYYTWTANGKEYEHIPDDDYTRDHWYIAWGNTKLCSKDFPGCFDVFDQKESIEKIAETLSAKIRTTKKLRTIRVYNDTEPEKFQKLEYGTYKVSDSLIREGSVPHGIKNHFSIQAPVGMLRLTEAELGFIMNSCLKTKKGVLNRLKKTVKKTPDPKDVKKLFRFLKKAGRITQEELEKVL